MYGLDVLNPVAPVLGEVNSTPMATRSSEPNLRSRQIPRRSLNREGCPRGLPERRSPFIIAVAILMRGDRSPQCRWCVGLPAEPLGGTLAV